MSMELWNLSGGSPKTTQGQLTVGGAGQDTTLVTVAAGKRIIPVWLLLYGVSADADRISKFVVRTAGSLDGNRSGVIVDNAKAFAIYMQPLFFNWGVLERNNFGDGENLKITLSSSDNTTALDVYKYALGYYLVDA